MRDVACSGFSRCCPRTFVTPRLQARLLDGQDAELFAACYGDAATMRHVGPTLDSAATARAFAAALRQLRSDPPAAFYWRLDTAAGAVGLLSLVPDVNRRRAETGVLLCAARGQGVAREALSMLLAHAFAGDALDAVWTRHRPGHVAAEGLMRALAFLRLDDAGGCVRWEMSRDRWCQLARDPGAR